jgi:hypothetical protein
MGEEEYRRWREAVDTQESQRIDRLSASSRTTVSPASTR